jgi:hypothetical protein
LAEDPAGMSRTFLQVLPIAGHRYVSYVRHRLGHEMGHVYVFEPRVVALALHSTSACAVTKSMSRYREMLQILSRQLAKRIDPDE